MLQKLCRRISEKYVATIDQTKNVSIPVVQRMELSQRKEDGRFIVVRNRSKWHDNFREYILFFTQHYRINENSLIECLDRIVYVLGKRFDTNALQLVT